MEAIVLYPSPAIGHLIPMLELAKLLLKQHNSSVSIHILNVPPPYRASDTAPYISKVSATLPSITFHHLPTVTLPPSVIASSRHHESLTIETLHLSNPNVHDALVSISQDHAVLALVADEFCASVLPVAGQLKIPLYFYSTCGAASLASSLYFPNIHKSTTKSLKDINILIDFPGVPLIPSKDLPKPLLERGTKAYEFLLDSSSFFQKSSGILVNTFESLEPRALKAISDGLCITDGPTPPVYQIGPIIAADDRRGTTLNGGCDEIEGASECLKWLDSQPNESVVFLCFGSLGLFSKEQLNEIAVGLEKSGHSFLWVVRNPPPDKKESVAISGQPDPDLDSLLPNGFLDRTKGRGFVMKSWAPQVAILSHKSVGGFVTHCGWNSVLESVVCGGVPMVAWPLYAEQRFNRILLVEEIKIALSMIESEDGFVSAVEVEKRVNELMNSEKGNSMRKRTKDLQVEAKAALGEGGSSLVALIKWIKSLKNN